jgi:hypothetical protein
MQVAVQEVHLQRFFLNKKRAEMENRSKQQGDNKCSKGKGRGCHSQNQRFKKL